MFKRLVVAAVAVIAVGSVAGCATASGEASAARPPCADSNGARPGGSVYVRYGQRLTCDVRPPQRLHVTRVPSRQAALDMGGRWMRVTSTYGTAFDVDY